MKDAITWVGLDVHKATIQVAMLLPDGRAPVEWQVANEPAAVKRLARKVQHGATGEVRSCYEAGVCYTSPVPSPPFHAWLGVGRAGLMSYDRSSVAVPF